MPHIRITMLPGRDPEQKKALATKLREILARELEVAPIIVSVSMEDLPMKDWCGFLERLPNDSIIIPSEKREKGDYEKGPCNCC